MQSSMETTLDAIRRNQHVIEALLKGDYEVSRLKSQVAVDVIGTLLTRPSRKDHHEALYKMQEGREHIVGGRVWSIPLSPTNNNLSVTNGGAVAFFNQALGFHLEDHGFSQDALHQDTTLAAIVLYNAGLSQHLSAIHCATLRSHRLKKALHAYSIASSILSSAAASPNGLLCGFDEGVDLVVLALLNNMAHIYSFFSDMRMATECVEAMNDVLESPSMGSDDESSDMAEGVLFLTMAASLYREDSFVGCPAA
jgi:hypothetical protein